MNRAMRVFVDCANQQTSDGTVNVRAALGALSLDMICGKRLAMIFPEAPSYTFHFSATTLGFQMNTQKGHNSEMLEAVYE